MAKKVLRYTEEQFVTLLENIVKKVKKQESIIGESKRDYPIRRTVTDTASMRKYGQNTKWPRNEFAIKNYGPITVFIGPGDEVKVACIGEDCFDQNDQRITKDEAAQMLGVDSLDMIGESKNKNRRLR
jgi:hypothetical protein